MVPLNQVPESCCLQPNQPTRPLPSYGAVQLRNAFGCDVLLVKIYFRPEEASSFMSGIDPFRGQVQLSHRPPDHLALHHLRSGCHRYYH